MVIKFVATRAGATACTALAARGIPTLLTAIYDPGQAIVAAAAGATYIAPYLRAAERCRSTRDCRSGGHARSAGRHRQHDEGAAGQASRSVPDMVALARHGVDCFTMAPDVAEQFFTDPTTAEAAHCVRRRRPRDLGMTPDADAAPAVRPQPSWSLATRSST